MTRIVFRDFDEFADAVGGVIGRFVPTARSTKEWWMHSVATGRVLTQTLQIGSAATFAGDGKRDEVAVQIPLTNPTKIRVDGQFLDADSLLLIKEGFPFTLSTSEPTLWAGIAVPWDHALLPPGLLESLQSQLFSKSTTSRAQTTAEHLDRLRHLAARLCAATDSVALDAAAVRCAEEEIIAAVSRVLEASSKAQPRRVGRPPLPRSRIVASALALVEASAGAPLLIKDLCGATGVSERTLRHIFHECFGCGPTRLLRVRQLHEIRAALLAADPEHDSVSRIATRLGIWDFSLFARNYKALFGESPSQTLRAAPPRTQRNVTLRVTWLHYACRALANQLAMQSEGPPHTPS